MISNICSSTQNTLINTMDFDPATGIKCDFDHISSLRDYNAAWNEHASGWAAQKKILESGNSIKIKIPNVTNGGILEFEGKLGDFFEAMHTCNAWTKPLDGSHRWSV